MDFATEFKALCPKCRRNADIISTPGEDTPEPVYASDGQWISCYCEGDCTRAKEPFPGEHVHLTCGACGYDKRVPCADADVLTEDPYDFTDMLCPQCGGNHTDYEESMSFDGSERISAFRCQGCGFEYRICERRDID